MGTPVKSSQSNGRRDIPEADPSMKVRCPVCGGTGGVEPTFSFGCVGPCGTSSISAKTCPACHGTGMQDTENKIGERDRSDLLWDIQIKRMNLYADEVAARFRDPGDPISQPPKKPHTFKEKLLGFFGMGKIL
jgi:hypothetical protein